MKIKQLFSGDTDNTFIQFFRYVFVGGFAFVVDYGIMWSFAASTPSLPRLSLSWQDFW